MYFDVLLKQRIKLCATFNNVIINQNQNQNVMFDDDRFIFCDAIIINNDEYCHHQINDIFTLNNIVSRSEDE